MVAPPGNRKAGDDLNRRERHRESKRRGTVGARRLPLDLPKTKMQRLHDPYRFSDQPREEAVS